MISVLTEPKDVFETYPLIRDLQASFGQITLDKGANLKIKKNRRRHLEDMDRFKKTGVIKRA